MAVRSWVTCQSWATTSEPSRLAASGPRTPLRRGTSRILRSVKTCRRSKRGCRWPRTARSEGRRSHWRSLFIKGAMAWARSPSLRLSYQAQNGPKASGSLSPVVSERRKPGLVSSSGSITRVASGRRAKVSKQACRMSWVRGPQASAYKALKTLRMPSATTSGRWLRVVSGFRPTGAESAASRTTTSSRRWSGSRARTSSIRSPFGSITTTARPSWMSCWISRPNSADLPTPVGPRMWVCWRASRALSARWAATPGAVARASTRPAPVVPGAGGSCLGCAAGWPGKSSLPSGHAVRARASWTLRRSGQNNGLRASFRRASRSGLSRKVTPAASLVRIAASRPSTRARRRPTEAAITPIRRVQAKPWSLTLFLSAARFSLSTWPPLPRQAAWYQGATMEDGLCVGMASGTRREPSTSCSTRRSSPLTWDSAPRMERTVASGSSERSARCRVEALNRTARPTGWRSMDKGVSVVPGRALASAVLASTSAGRGAPSRYSTPSRPVAASSTKRGLRWSAAQLRSTLVARAGSSGRFQCSCRHDKAALVMPDLSLAVTARFSVLDCCLGLGFSLSLGQRDCHDGAAELAQIRRVTADGAN